MRDYGKVSPQFWVGDTGKRIRALGPECQVIALYLMSSPHANMLGLYYLPTVLLSHETGIPIEGASEGLQSLSEAGFCSYDEASEVVWVHEMARFQIGESLKPKDNRVSGVSSALKNVPKNKYLRAWYEKYKDAYHLPENEAPSKPLGSQKQEQEQKQDISTADAVDTDGDNIEKKSQFFSPPKTEPEGKEKFPMSLDWQPGDCFDDRCAMAGHPVEGFSMECRTEVLGEFRSYWVTQTERRETQSTWEHKLLQRLIQKRREIEKNPPPKSGSLRNRSLADNLNDRSWAT